MQLNFQKSISGLICIFSIIVSAFIFESASAQVSRLVIIPTLNQEGIHYNLSVKRLADEIEVYSSTFENGSIEFVDSLKPGRYQVSISEFPVSTMPQGFCPLFSKSIDLKADESFTLTCDLAYETHYEKYDSLKGKLYNERGEAEIYLSVMDASWLNSNTVIGMTSTMGFSQYYWKILGKRLGLMVGGGFGYGYYAINKDTTFANQPQYKKITENYSYLDAHGTVKFRISQHNQRFGEHQPLGLFLDLGVSYNLPLMFRHIARYQGERKIATGNLHQFTDVRGVVNVGKDHVALFFDYRLSDFIINQYSELPQMNAGIRIMIQY